MAYDVRSVEREAEPLRLVTRQPGERPVQLGREPLRALQGEALVLDPDGVRVHVPVARVPGDVLRRHHLRDATVRGADHVMGAHVRVRVLELRERRVVALLSVVDDHVADRQAVAGTVGEVVVAVVERAGAVLSVRRRQELALQLPRALSARFLAVHVGDAGGAVLGVSMRLTGRRYGAAACDGGAPDGECKRAKPQRRSDSGSISLANPFPGRYVRRMPENGGPTRPEARRRSARTPRPIRRRQRVSGRGQAEPRRTARRRRTGRPRDRARGRGAAPRRCPPSEPA